MPAVLLARLALLEARRGGLPWLALGSIALGRNEQGAVGVVSVDDRTARAMPGVLGVARIPTGVAVAAETFGQAQAARDALRITWDPGPNAALSDADIRARLQAATLPFVAPPLGALSSITSLSPMISVA